MSSSSTTSPPTVRAIPQKSRSDSAASKTRNERYSPPGLPFKCNLCREQFASLYSVKRHFDRVCYRKHKLRAPRAKWSDHPTCLTQNAALLLPCARPLYPTYQVHNTATGQRIITWPALSGWPTSPADLERKNAAHLAITGANPHFVDTRENVYADVVEDEEAFVAGEDPVAQLGYCVQIVDARSVRFLMRVVKEETWMHGWADDVLFAVALHRSEEEVAELVGCTVEVAKKWFAQAEGAVFREHVRVSSGPNTGDRTRVLVEQQEVRWREAVGEFRAKHERECGGEWRRLMCCHGERIEEAFLEVREGVGSFSSDETEEEFAYG